MAEGEGEPRQIEVQMPEAMRAGVWANFAAVVASPYEFTLDFARLEHDAKGPTGGIVVARVSMSPLFIRQLIDALDQNWTKYAERAMPPEVRIDDVQGDSGEEPRTGTDDQG